MKNKLLGEILALRILNIVLVLALFYESYF